MIDCLEQVVWRRGMGVIASDQFSLLRSVAHTRHDIIFIDFDGSIDFGAIEFALSFRDNRLLYVPKTMQSIIACFIFTREE
jgi:hypothetical protein